MSDKSKPTDIPVLTFAECMKRLYHFIPIRMESGGMLLESPDGSKRVVIARGENALHFSRIYEVLESFDFQPAEVAKVRDDLAEYDTSSAISIRKTLETLDALGNTAYVRHKQSEKTLKWMGDLFNKLDAEREAYKNSRQPAQD